MQSERRGQVVGRLIGAGNTPVFLNLRQLEHDPVAEHLAVHWRRERLSEPWRRRFVTHCRRAGRPLFPSVVLDDGTVLTNAHDGSEASITYSQVIGFVDRTYAQIAGFKFSPGDGDADSVMSWHSAVDQPGLAAGRCPIYRSRTGATFIDQVVVDKLVELD
ncbi:hypothetical protein [Mycolicibacterium goodii]|uniref:hypothetical protein n=1 Tax=Mycolicibacterium goodii TaxID=134601 RepID=UPI001BDD6C6D|nr:hypothetical protein [Mycolicibacterium goodii]MBU8839105.1 hypothetical protein [Mycolicibacterium goodii]